MNKSKCSICNQEITADPFGWDGGCNAEPINNGTCCYECDINVVLPSRLVQQGIDRRDVEGIVAEIWQRISNETSKGAE